MPLVLHKNIENGQIGLWKISEEVEELMQLSRLNSEDLITFSGISALHRQKEWLATRALINNLNGKPVQIKYFNDGKPYPENCNFNLSISHTREFVAVLIHQNLIPGIDIELESRQVGKVASRFLSPDEFDICNEHEGISNRKLLIHWCAKEAVFKMVPFSNIEFSSDIQIVLNDVSNNSGSFPGIFKNSSVQIPVNLDYLETNGVLMVWGCMKRSIQITETTENSFNTNHDQ